MKNSVLLNHYPKLDKDIIRNIHEECQCEYCGWPMYVNDTCYVSEDLGKIFCGNYCYKLSLEI